MVILIVWKMTTLATQTIWTFEPSLYVFGCPYPGEMGSSDSSICCPDSGKPTHPQESEFKYPSLSCESAHIISSASCVSKSVDQGNICTQSHDTTPQLKNRVAACAGQAAMLSSSLRANTNELIATATINAVSTVSIPTLRECLEFGFRIDSILFEKVDLVSKLPSQNSTLPTDQSRNKSKHQEQLHQEQKVQEQLLQEQKNEVQLHELHQEVQHICRVSSKEQILNPSISPHTGNDHSKGSDVETEAEIATMQVSKEAYPKDESHSQKMGDDMNIKKSSLKRNDTTVAEKKPKRQPGQKREYRKRKRCVDETISNEVIFESDLLDPMTLESVALEPVLISSQCGTRLPTMDEMEGPAVNKIIMTHSCDILTSLLIHFEELKDNLYSFPVPRVDVNQPLKTQVFSTMYACVNSNIRAVTTFLRKNQGFSAFELEDRIKLTQHSFYPLLIILFGLKSNPDTGEHQLVNICPEDAVKIVSELPQFAPLLAHFRDLGTTIRIMNLDDTELALMCMMTVLSAGRHQLTSPTVISDQLKNGEAVGALYDMYHSLFEEHLLEKYCLHEDMKRASFSRYHAIMWFISQLYAANEDHTRFASWVYQSSDEQVDPVWKETYINR